MTGDVVMGDVWAEADESESIKKLCLKHETMSVCLEYFREV